MLASFVHLGLRVRLKKNLLESGLRQCVVDVKMLSLHGNYPRVSYLRVKIHYDFVLMASVKSVMNMKNVHLLVKVRRSVCVTTMVERVMMIRHVLHLRVKNIRETRELMREYVEKNRRADEIGLVLSSLFFMLRNKMFQGLPTHKIYSSIK